MFFVFFWHCPTDICEGGLEVAKGEAHNRDQFLEYFQDNCIEGNYPVHMWNMYALDGPLTLKGGTQRFVGWLIKHTQTSMRLLSSSKLSKQLQK